MKHIFLTASLVLFVGAVTSKADSPQDKEITVKVMTNQAGMTLYVFDVDAPNVSTCSGGCARVWPPVPAPVEPVQVPFGIITRADGTQQLTFNQRPLYTYALDNNPGDINGDMVQNTWHIAQTKKGESQCVPSIQN